MPRRRKPRVGDVAIPVFQAASQTGFAATAASQAASQTGFVAIAESPAGAQSSSGASTDSNHLANNSGTTLELAPPRDLWDEAYQALREGDSKLAEQYEETIMRVDQEDTRHARLAPVRTPARQVQLSAVIKRRLDSIEEDQTSFTVAGRRVVRQEQLDKVVRIVMFAKDFVSSAVSAEPHAALAWAGVCVLLPVSIGIDPLPPLKISDQEEYSWPAFQNSSYKSKIGLDLDLHSWGFDSLVFCSCKVTETFL